MTTTGINRTESIKSRITVKKAALLLIGLVVLSGCGTTASVPTEGQSATADYGDPISTADCQSLARAAITERIGDTNAQVSFDGPCRRNWVAAIPEAGYPIEYGYYVTGTVNTGNTASDYYVLVRDGRAVRAAISGQADQVTVWRP